MAVIYTNVASLNAQRNLSNSAGSLATSLQRLSSGLRINSAKDDAAGLAISERFTSQIRGIDQATRNANDGISLAQTCEGALASAGDILQRIRELAVQSVNATNSSSDRAALQAEVSQLSAELDRIASSTSFNGQHLLDGSTTNTFQVGANAGEVITTSTSNFRTDNYGNYRIGSLAATTTSSLGDLTVGSTPTAIRSNAASASRVKGSAVTINGSLGSANVTVAAGASAKTVIAAINAKSSVTGVSASAQTKIDANLTAGQSYSWNVTSNNSSAVAVSFTVGSPLNADALSAGVNAINDASSKTGVTAQVNAATNGITLLNASGENITIFTNTGSAYAVIGGFTPSSASRTAIATGEIVLDSDKSFSVVSNGTGVSPNITTGLTDFFNAKANAAQLQKVSQVDVGNVDAANRTISLVDAALQTINGQRARFGAVQSRFESTIANLRSTSENLSASRSRIRDTDFAAETANLTRNQILQQAGTAMLAQANALPQQVLTLLK